MMAVVDAESRLPELEVMLKSKSCKGRMVADLLRQITEIPDLYRFQTYSSLPNVQELRTSDLAVMLDVMTLFSRGTYRQYRENATQYPSFSEKQIFALRCLTLASIANESENQKISFKTIQEELGFTDHWQVFDFLIEALNFNYVKGKVDEPAGDLIVEDFITRDFDMASEGKDIRTKLELFSAACDNTVLKMKEESARIDEQKRLAETQKKELAAKVDNLRGQFNFSDDGPMNSIDAPVRQKLDLTGKFFKSSRPKK